MGEIKLGSLFDGSGGFPLAGTFFGIVPVWASEIEPYPIRVTTARFPHMKHLGDITKIDGGSIEPVDIITFGSPCQDLSIAGKQAGIHDGQRSNLFFEAVRIIQEMRRATDGKYPRFAVWENVPGAFSSNKGQDFRAVLEALSAIKDPNVIIPEPPKGKWQHAGAIVADGYSIAWRVYDAQFWGVPQRRKRIYLIADFGSERAGEILFEPESVRGHFETRRTQGQGTPDNVTGSIAGSHDGELICYCDNGTTPTLRAAQSGSNTVPDVVYPINTMVATRWQKDDGRTTFGIGEDGDPEFTLQEAHEHAVCYSVENHPHDSRVKIDEHGKVQTLSSHMGTGGNNVPLVLCVGNGQSNQAIGDKAGTLNCMHDPQAVLCVATQQGGAEIMEDKCPTITASAGMSGNNQPYICTDGQKRKYIVRRLTPLECCRLQGFPDWWTDGIDGSNAAQYKMWGNGIALPCAVDVIGRLHAEMEKCGNALK